MEDSLEPRKHGGKVVLQTASAPDGFAFRAGARLGLDKRARHRRGVQPASTHLAQIGPLPLPEIISPRFGFAQQSVDLGRDQMLMRDQTQSRELLGSRRRSAIGHDCGGVPVENGDCLLDRA